METLMYQSEGCIDSVKHVLIFLNLKIDTYLTETCVDFIFYKPSPDTLAVRNLMSEGWCKNQEGKR